MDACRECPLSPGNLLDQHCSWPRKVMNISYLKEIELHVATSISCLHPELKNLVLSGPLEGSTLLLVACQDENLEAVRYMVENWQVDVKTTATHYDYYQPRLPSDELYHRTKTEGSAALLVASSHTNNQIFHYLLDQGADIMARGSNGFTPIFMAASRLHLPLVDFLLERSDVDRTEKVDAAELTAAKLLIYQSEAWSRVDSVELANEYLRRALLLREMEVDPVQETPVMTLKSGRTVELISSTVQIEQLILQPSEHHFQACLIGLRVCSTRSWRAFFGFAAPVIICADSLKEQHQFVDALDLLWALIEKIRQFHLHYQEGIFILAFGVAGELLKMLLQLEKDDPILISTTFQLPLQLIAATHLFGHPTDYADDKMREFIDHDYELFVLYFIVAYTASRPGILTDGIRDVLCQLVLQDHRSNSRQTMLHYALSRLHGRGLSWLHGSDVSLAAVQLLLECQSDPNADDHKGNGPMHTLAYQYDGNQDDEALDSAARLLLEHGAHLCKVNLKGNTAAQIVGFRRRKYSDLPTWCRSVPKLICLSAKFINSKNVAHEESDLPATLHAFLVNHSH